jgi:hypothetical protein
MVDGWLVLIQLSDNSINPGKMEVKEKEIIPSISKIFS